MPDPLPLAAQDPISQLSTRLQQEFPTEFGGLLLGTGKSFSLLEVAARNANLEATANSLVAKLPEAMRTAGWAQTATTNAKFQISPQIVSYPLQRLDEVRLAIKSRLASDDLIGVGLDQQHNKVVVIGKGTPAGQQTLDGLENQYPGLLEVQTGNMPTPMTGRLSDSSPWNGGDQIIRGGAGNGCTSGFGMHSPGTGSDYNVTAGHCGAGSWYNGSSLLGNTKPGSVVYAPGNTPQTASIDSQVLQPTGSGSSCIVWGGYSTPGEPLIRYYITGNIDADSGQPAWLEGAYGTEIQTTIIADHLTFGEAEPQQPGQPPPPVYYVENGFETTLRPIPGDSGGPAIDPSIYGPLALGVLTAGDESTGHGFSQYLSSLRYSYQINTKLSPNGTSC